MSKFNRLTRGLALVALILPACERQTSQQDAKILAKSPTTNAPSTLSNAEAKTDLVQVRGGKFTMGDKEQLDAPVHEVAVTSFLIDKYLVTQQQFQKVMG